VKFSQTFFKVLIAVMAMVLCTFQACREIEKPNKLVDDGVFQKIDKYLDLEDQNGFSGIINIKIKDKPLYTRAFGYANKEEKVKINAATVFDIGSLTKQFTAAAILKLEMEGQLRVEDSLIKFFPNIPSDKSSITLHQLLTHTSGLKKSVGFCLFQESFLVFSF
jgi:CubicO group peptidase (beta-lactamase class C family)